MPKFMNLKKLTEQRAEKQKAMKALIDAADTEERTLNEEETKKFEDLEKEIDGIDASIRALQSIRDLNEEIPQEGTKEENEKDEEQEKREVEKREYAIFESYLRGKVEERADENLTKSENGAVIPTSIANKIITKAVDMCPIYQDAERYNVGGTLTIPYYDESTKDIKMEYANEFTDGESTSGKFASITLTGHLARAITDISKSLINNSSFNIVDFLLQNLSRKNFCMVPRIRSRDFPE